MGKFFLFIVAILGWAPTAQARWYCTNPIGKKYYSDSPTYCHQYYADGCDSSKYSATLPPPCLGPNLKQVVTDPAPSRPNPQPIPQGANLTPLEQKVLEATDKARFHNQMAQDYAKKATEATDDEAEAQRWLNLAMAELSQAEYWTNEAKIAANLSGSATSTSFLTAAVTNLNILRLTVDAAARAMRRFHAPKSTLTATHLPSGNPPPTITIGFTTPGNPADEVLLAKSKAVQLQTKMNALKADHKQAALEYGGLVYGNVVSGKDNFDGGLALTGSGKGTGASGISGAIREGKMPTLGGGGAAALSLSGGADPGLGTTRLDGLSPSVGALGFGGSSSISEKEIAAKSRGAGASSRGSSRNLATVNGGKANTIENPWVSYLAETTQDGMVAHLRKNPDLRSALRKRIEELKNSEKSSDPEMITLMEETLANAETSSLEKHLDELQPLTAREAFSMDERETREQVKGILADMNEIALDPQYHSTQSLFERVTIAHRRSVEMGRVRLKAAAIK